MACTRVIFQNAISPLPYSFHNRNPSQFLPSKSILRLKKQTLLSSPIRIKIPRTHHVVYAAQSSFSKDCQTAWKFVKDKLEEGINLVSDIIPRPIARIAVYYFALTLALKSIRSTSFFALALMVLGYFTFKALTESDDGPEEGGESEPSSNYILYHQQHYHISLFGFSIRISSFTRTRTVQKQVFRNSTPSSSGA